MARTGAGGLLLTALALLAGAAPAAAQRVVTSPRPDAVAVTVYRDNQRGAAQPLNLRFLGGYALITETRRISLPAGESEIRFEGVAAGMVPQSAIVAGFPQDIVERNRDAYLLSPATLVERSLGRRVTLRRRSVATGRVRQHEAVIRTGAGGAVVLETADGFETLRCTGLPETIVYDGVPRGLSARPTLSVRTRAARAVTATVTLSYMASGFDWQANYIATLSEDGERADLFAWLTLASNDETSFPNADTQAVAGYVNREPVDAQEAEGGALELRCWAHSTTSDIPLEQFTPTPLSPPLPVVQDEEFIMVTGGRVERSMMMSSPAPLTVMTAEQFTLGDVKLYRIPEPVTIAANSQKQVALLQREDARFAIVHRQIIGPWRGGAPLPAARILVARNTAADGLGLPLPAGQIVLFAQGTDRPVLLGEGMIDDRAVGDEIEIGLGQAPGVTTVLRALGPPHSGDYELVVTNDDARPVRFEALFESAQEVTSETELGRRDGRPLWATTVPANGTATLRYRRP